MNRDQWARGILTSVWVGDLGSPPPGGLQAVQAIARHESGASYAAESSNNWGSVHCSGPPCPAGCVEKNDLHAKGDTYRACFRTYATAEDGARDLVRELLRREQVRAVLSSGNALAIAGAMRTTGYHETNPNVYGAAIARNAQAVATALGEPLIVKLGGEASEASSDALLFVAIVGVLLWRGAKRRKG